MKNTGILLLLSSALLLAACDTTPVADTTPPSLALEASPGTVSASGTVILRATASDDKGVVKVSFYRGETLIGEDTTAPYEMTDAVPVGASDKVNYRAVAVDAAGNRAEAKAETSVTDKTAPSITLEASPRVCLAENLEPEKDTGNVDAG